MKRLLLFLILALSAHGQILEPILSGSTPTVAAPAWLQGTVTPTDNGNVAVTTLAAPSIAETAGAAKIVTCYWYKGDGVVTVNSPTDGSSTFTQLGTVAVSSGGAASNMAMFVAFGITGSAGRQTFCNWPSSVRFVSVSVDNYSGATATGGTPVIATNVTPTSDSVNLSNITTTANNALVYVACNAQNGPMSAGTNVAWNLRSRTTATNYTSSIAEDYVSPTAGALTPQLTDTHGTPSGGDNLTCIAAALKP